MKLFDTDPKLRWAFCMTHPDDEISICAWIKRLAMQGNEVHLSWTHSNEVREREARAVAMLLGIPSSRLHFFGATDGGVVDELGLLLPRFQSWIASVNPDRVCCGAFEQGHIDHDATNFLVSQSFDGPILEIPFYHTYTTRFQVLNKFADPAGEELLSLTRSEQQLKTHVARQYPSQNIWTILRWYEVWQKAKLRPMELTRNERMRLQTHFDYLTPNLPPRLAARVKGCTAWRRWVSAVSPFVARSESTARLVTTG